MPDAKMYSAKMYRNGRLLGSFTSKSVQLTSNRTQIPTDAGNVTQVGIPTGSFSGDYVVKHGDSMAPTLIQDLIDGETISITYGVVGTKILQADCIVSEVNSTSTTADGSQTGTCTLTMLDGKPKLT